MSLQFAAAIPGAVYALLGSSRQLNVAPEAALSLLVGQAVQAALHGDPHDHPADTAKVAIAVTTVITLQVRYSSPLFAVYYAHSAAQMG